MTKIYTIEMPSDSGLKVVGVFSSKEKATEAAKDWVKGTRTWIKGMVAVCEHEMGSVFDDGGFLFYVEEDEKDYQRRYKKMKEKEQKRPWFNF